jgi:hypothetical protein
MSKGSYPMYIANGRGKRPVIIMPIMMLLSRTMMVRVNLASEIFVNTQISPVSNGCKRFLHRLISLRGINEEITKGFPQEDCL